MRFHDDGTMSSKWTWYQNGQEQWMEEIQYRRFYRAARDPKAE
jgi:hypothetical protein